MLDDTEADKLAEYVTANDHRNAVLALVILVIMAVVFYMGMLMGESGVRAEAIALGHADYADGEWRWK